MIYVLVGMSLLFISIGFILTEGNAKYMLSGYNTMSEEDRKKVDIKANVPFFRKFHFFLGLSLLIIGVLLTYFVSNSAGGIFLAVYPILAYLYFMWKSIKYSSGINSKWSKIGVYILAGTLLFIGGLFALGLKEDKLVLSSNRIEIKGSYGEKINPSEIKEVELVNKLPGISIKTNAFALGTVKKGYFKTKEGEIVKFILNSATKPYILLTKVNGKKIYFSSKERPNEEIYAEIKKALPNLVHKQ